jgi:23S rRNA pseudouridine1911/1915/1917 synthase
VRHWIWETGNVKATRADLAILEALEAGLGSWTPSETAEEFSSISRSQIKKWIEDGRVSLDGAPAKANSKIQTGSKIRIELPKPEPLALVPEDRPLEILFEDSDLLVVNKPPGLTVHPSSTQKEGTLVHALLHHIKDLSGIGGVLRPGIVHRLDKDTSGALVISKSDRAHVALVEKFSKHDMERVYWALCYGSFKQPSLKIETLIGRNPKDRKRMSSDVKTGRKAITHLKRLENFGSYACWVQAQLETGRTHQVRVHLTGAGHSVLGDPVYGTPNSKSAKWLALPSEVREAVAQLPGQALHARVLGFEHPITKKRLRFEAEPPAEFRGVLEALKRA